MWRAEVDWGGANMFAAGCVDGDVLATVNISAAGEDKLFSGKHQHNKGVTHARFHFHNPVKIYFGKGQACHIAQEVERVEGAVLVVYGGGSIKRNGAYDDVMAALAGTGRKSSSCRRYAEPAIGQALEGVRLVKEHGVGLILAVGGGSVIDCAKFISLGSGIGDDEDLWDDYIETGKPAPEGLIPVGVVLTTAATGSEMGDAAVLTNWERNRKLGYTSFPADAQGSPCWIQAT